MARRWAPVDSDTGARNRRLSQITVQLGKGAADRVDEMLPAAVGRNLAKHLETVRDPRRQPAQRGGLRGATGGAPSGNNKVPLL